MVATSCVSSTSSLQPEVVSRIDAQKQQYVVFGTIRDTNKVTIEDDREVGAPTSLSSSIVTLLVSLIVPKTTYCCFWASILETTSGCKELVLLTHEVATKIEIKPTNDLCIYFFFI